jgi:hypothetical protein
MIVARMVLRLDAKKIERERFGTHERSRDLLISPLGHELQVENIHLQKLILMVHVGEFCWEVFLV